MRRRGGIRLLITGRGGGVLRRICRRPRSRLLIFNGKINIIYAADIDLLVALLIALIICPLTFFNLALNLNPLPFF